MMNVQFVAQEGWRSGRKEREAKGFVLWVQQWAI